MSVSHQEQHTKCCDVEIKDQAAKQHVLEGITQLCVYFERLLSIPSISNALDSSTLSKSSRSYKPVDKNDSDHKVVMPVFAQYFHLHASCDLSSCYFHQILDHVNECNSTHSDVLPSSRQATTERTDRIQTRNHVNVLCHIAAILRFNCFAIPNDLTQFSSENHDNTFSSISGHVNSSKMVADVIRREVKLIETPGPKTKKATKQLHVHPDINLSENITHQTIGRVLLLQSSLFNHSCVPAAAQCFHGGSIRIVSTIDIPQHCSVNLSYGPLCVRSPLHRRYEETIARFGFLCNCSACKFESDVSSTNQENIPNDGMFDKDSELVVVGEQMRIKGDTSANCEWCDTHKRDTDGNEHGVGCTSKCYHTFTTDKRFDDATLSVLCSHGRRQSENSRKDAASHLQTDSCDAQHVHIHHSRHLILKCRSCATLFGWKELSLVTSLSQLKNAIDRAISSRDLVLLFEHSTSSLGGKSHRCDQNQHQVSRFMDFVVKNNLDKSANTVSSSLSSSSQFLTCCCDAQEEIQACFDCLQNLLQLDLSNKHQAKQACLIALQLQRNISSRAVFFAVRQLYTVLNL